MSEVRIKRAYDPPASGDGARLLVDRLWPRGLKRDGAEIDLWLKDVAPSAELRRWFGHAPARWSEFLDRRQAELPGNAALGELLAIVKQGKPMMLLFGARNGAQQRGRAERFLWPRLSHERRRCRADHPCRAAAGLRGHPQHPCVH